MVAQPRPNAEAVCPPPRPIFAPSIFPKINTPFSSRFAYVLLQFFPPRTPQQLLPKRRRSGEKPLNSAAEAGATSGLDLPQGALFYNALTLGSWP